MQDKTIQERFEALRQAYIQQNPVDLRDDPQVEDAMVAWEASDSRACVACDVAEGGGNH